MICEDCTDGWNYFERPVSLGGGPSEHFTYETCESPARAAKRESRTMRCEYTTGCHLTCPSDGKVIQYRVQIITEAMVMVEEIIKYLDKLNGEPMFQEHLTQDLAVKFKCKCKTFATHQGVAVDCTEDLR